MGPSGRVSTLALLVVARSATGYPRRLAPGELDGLLLATAMAGEPLRRGLGAPVRLVAPGRRGFWWVTRVVALEVEDAPSWWQPPLPLQEAPRRGAATLAR